MVSAPRGRRAPVVRPCSVRARDRRGDQHRAEPELLTWWQTLMEIPCVAIGGITPDNCGPLVDAGADFLAVSAAVWRGDEAEAVRAFVRRLDQSGSSSQAKEKSR